MTPHRETDWDRIRTLYARLVVLYQREGHTYTDIAARAGLHPNAVPKFLRYRTPPTIDTLIRLVRGLGLSPATFFVILDNQDVDHHIVTTLRAALLTSSTAPLVTTFFRSEPSYGVVASRAASRQQDIEELRTYLAEGFATLTARIDTLEQSRKDDRSAPATAPRRPGKGRTDRNQSRQSA